MEPIMFRRTLFLLRLLLLSSPIPPPRGTKIVGVVMADEKVLALDADGTKAATGRRAAEESRAATDRWSFMPVLRFVAYGSK